MRQKQYYIYILTNKRNTVLYTGVTNNLSARTWQHIEKQNAKSFTAKYNLNKLVYMEEYPNIYDAIAREKQIKAGSRKNKIGLIENINPEWKDLLI
ncbi:MAG: GIY-YIG nuclease family protein [Bacteroidales bacterium]|nr:GIY-YIG nuclease family protein [Bacteroidales bacterium]